MFVIAFEKHIGRNIVCLVASRTGDYDDISRCQLVKPDSELETERDGFEWHGISITHVPSLFQAIE